MNVAIIGCGLIGRKRARAFASSEAVVACCDTDADSAERFGKEFSCRPFTNVNNLFTEIRFDVVVVSVVNKFAKQIACDVLLRGKHVLVEKPLGRNSLESQEILSILENQNGSSSKDAQLSLKVGFNHRFHSAIWKAKELVDSGEIGKLLTIRAHYGHGGRPGMEKEWRASKELCGGGELLDQGVHVIDLIRWFGGEVREVMGRVETAFWPTEVEDNAFAILKTENNVTGVFHVSWTNWKNVFSFEIFGDRGSATVQGLGGSYGKETLEVAKRKETGGAPDVQILSFEDVDQSWKKEWSEFKLAIKDKRQPLGNGQDGLKANKIVEAIYQSSVDKRAVSL